MSAKRNKLIRKELKGLRLPEVITTVHIPRHIQYNPQHPFDLSKAIVFPEKAHKIVANHARRIRRFAQRNSTSIAQALNWYKLVGIKRIPASVEARG